MTSNSDQVIYTEHPASFLGEGQHEKNGLKYKIFGSALVGINILAFLLISAWVIKFLRVFGGK